MTQMAQRFMDVVESAKGRWNSGSPAAFGRPRHTLSEELGKRVAFGAAAGVAGTVVIQLLEMGASALSEDATAPIREDPGEFMVHQAERLVTPETRTKVPAAAETSVAYGLGFGYGASWGVLYGVVEGMRDRDTCPTPAETLVEGAALGITCWAAGYLGWLPASGLMKPVWKQKPAQALTPIALHAAYGIATVATYHALKSNL